MGVGRMLKLVEEKDCVKRGNVNRKKDRAKESLKYQKRRKLKEEEREKEEKEREKENERAKEKEERFEF
jgi:hypothetical protein